MSHSLADFQDLTEPQRILLERLEQDERFTNTFYFTGGTLLKALGIVPRESNDLDFFTFPGTEERQFRQALAATKHALEAELGHDAYDETDRGFVLKKHGTFVDCIFDTTPLIDKIVRYGNLSTAGARDIAAAKASALCCRDEVKDYIDIAFFTKRNGLLLADLERFAEEKYRLRTVTEEKLLAELLQKRDLFTINPAHFLRDGEANVQLVQEQITFLLEHTSL